MGKLILK